MTKLPLSKKAPKLFLVFIILILSVALLCGHVTFAWIFATSEDDVKVIYSNFKVEGDIYFEVEGTRYEITDYLSNGYINLKVDSASAPDGTTPAINYIANLRINAQYKGIGEAYLRLKLIEEWMIWTEEEGTEELVAKYERKPFTKWQFSENTPAGINSLKWYDNRKEDMCIYFYGKMTESDGVGKVYNDDLANWLEMPLISALDYSSQENREVRIKVIVEAVQTNRYKQLWKIQKLPWA